MGESPKSQRKETYHLSTSYFIIISLILPLIGLYCLNLTIPSLGSLNLDILPSP